MNTEQLKNYGTRLILELLDEHEGKDGLKKVQRALNSMGKNLVVDGLVGNITFHAIKSVNNKTLHRKIYGNPSIRFVKPSEPTDQPSWVKFAYQELGIKEISGDSASTERIEQYHDTVGIAWADDDVPWCASFVGFVMLKANYRLVSNAFRALSWLNFGKRTARPVLGALAIKKRTGGGHVGFVVGKSEDEKHLYLLGGNQNDEVNISRYLRKDFVDLRVPVDYVDQYDLPIMHGKSGLVSED